MYSLFENLPWVIWVLIVLDALLFGFIVVIAFLALHIPPIKREAHHGKH